MASGTLTPTVRPRPASSSSATRRPLVLRPLDASVGHRSLAGILLAAREIMMPDREHCPDCRADFDPRDLGEVFFHAFGHREENRGHAEGFVFVTAGDDPDAWENEDPAGEA
jgi:hypothetical protein